MDKPHQMELFSKAFIRAFAAPLGFNHSELDYDNDSIDIKLIGKDFSGKFRSPEIHIQLKSTTDDFNKNGIIKFQINKKNYEDLRGTNLAFPRYLFIYLLPMNCCDWLIEKNSYVELYKNGYWYSLRNSPDINKFKSKIINIPKKNLITKSILLEMMVKASDGESL